MEYVGFGPDVPITNRRKKPNNMEINIKVKALEPPKGHYPLGYPKGFST